FDGGACFTLIAAAGAATHGSNLSDAAERKLEIARSMSTSIQKLSGLSSALKSAQNGIADISCFMSWMHSELDTMGNPETNFWNIKGKTDGVIQVSNRFIMAKTDIEVYMMAIPARLDIEFMEEWEQSCDDYTTIP